MRLQTLEILEVYGTLHNPPKQGFGLDLGRGSVTAYMTTKGDNADTDSSMLN